MEISDTALDLLALYRREDSLDCSWDDSLCGRLFLTLEGVSFTAIRNTVSEQ